MRDAAVVLLSGGQDSTTCLYWALSRWRRVRTVAFDYGQRHRVELLSAESNAKHAGVVEHVVLPVEALKVLGGAALTDDEVTVDVDARGTGNKFAERHGLPSTFVPGRNMLFLTLAAAYAARHGIMDVVTGVCQADAAGYPDCREEFVSSAEDALVLALDEPDFTVHAPLLHLSKADTWRLAAHLKIRGLIIERTHTCYQGVRGTSWEWGYGCGACGACDERRKGYEEAFNA